jgi:hypothetical protein
MRGHEARLKRLERALKPKNQPPDLMRLWLASKSTAELQAIAAALSADLSNPALPPDIEKELQAFWRVSRQ